VGYSTHLLYEAEHGAKGELRLSVSARSLIHDRDATFAAVFDTTFTSQDVTIIRTAVRSPNANAVAER